jgi:tripartite-type tricarboxylate transporter receptor subunit TctC
MRKSLMTVFVIVFLLITGISVFAQEYPNRPITFQVTYSAGGSADIGARVVAAIAEKQLGQPIVVTNKVGAGGQIGWTELARQKPDGYFISTIHFPHMHTAILDPERKAVFTAADIVPIITQALDPTVISVRQDSPWKNLKDLIEDAKKRPREIIAGIVGYLQDDEIGYLLAAESMGIRLRLVYYDAGPPALTALFGKNVDVLFCTVADNYSHWKSGRVRVLTIMDRDRTKFFPDVPTTVELGFPKVISASTRGIGAPKGLPEPILKKLQDVFKKSLETKEYMNSMDNAGTPVKVLVGKELVDYYWDSHKVAQQWVDYVRKNK